MMQTTFLFALVLAALLTACGGGGDAALPAAGQVTTMPAPHRSIRAEEPAP